MRQQQREVFVVPPPNTADVGRPRPFNRSPLAHKHDGCVMCRATVLLSAGMRTAPSAWCFLHGVRFVLHGGSGSSLWCRLDGWLLHRLLRSTAFMYNENCLSTTLLASNKCLLAAGTACRPWQCVRVGTPSHSPCSSTLAGMHQGVAYSKITLYSISCLAAGCCGACIRPCCIHLAAWFQTTTSCRFDHRLQACIACQLV